MKDLIASIHSRPKGGMQPVELLRHALTLSSLAWKHERNSRSRRHLGLLLLARRQGVEFGNQHLTIACPYRRSMRMHWPPLIEGERKVLQVRFIMFPEPSRVLTARCPQLLGTLGRKGYDV